MDSFLGREELDLLGFAAVGEDVLISRKTSIYAPERIRIGDHVRIDDFVFLSGDITLCNHIHIAPFCMLIGGSGGAGIVMRDYSGLSGRVTVYSISDDYSGEYMTNPTIPCEFLNVLQGRVTIHKYAIIGTSSVLLPGVEIGEGAAVGAMSLVSRSLPDWKICGGSPARPLKDRSRRLRDLERQFLEKLPPEENG
jgi:galactoside O-acetyltransferase